MIACMPSEGSDQTAHARSLIRVFTGHFVGSQGSKTSSDGQQRLSSACSDAQADLITKTRLYNFDPLKPHFYKVKLGFTGVYIIFLILLKHPLWVLFRTASPRRF